MLQPEIFDYIPNSDRAIWEQEPLRGLAKDGQLHAYKHSGFWHAMDMLRDKVELNNMWDSNSAPWKIWEK
ncbi:MAG: Glucose-1-phosphate cytidylyltransferase [Saezia sanguinis]